MIKKFLLVDNCDENYADLIEFKEPVKLEKVEKAINKCKKDFPDGYTNEDIYNYLCKVSNNFKIIPLIGLEKIYY